MLSLTNINAFSISIVSISGGSHAKDPKSRFVETPRIENTPSNYTIIALYTPNPRHSFHSQSPDTWSGKKNPTHRCPEQTVPKRPVYALEIVGEGFDTGDKMGFLKATIRFDLKRPEIGPELCRFLSELMAWESLKIEIPASRRITMPLDRIAFSIGVVTTTINRHAIREKAEKRMLVEALERAGQMRIALIKNTEFHPVNSRNNR